MKSRFLAAIVFAFAPAAMAQSLTGLWDATVVLNGLEIPFRMEFGGQGANIHGSFFNGDERVTSTSGRFEDGKLSLTFGHYATKLDATLKDGVLEGRYTGGRSAADYPFRAVRHSAWIAAKTNAPSINGMWEIEVKSIKGESAWRFIVRQTGAEVSAAILRVDGDTGTLTGSYKDGKFLLSHFSGARPSLYEVTPQADGSLEILQNGKNKLVAYRPTEARAKGLPEPTDPDQHTRVRDAGEPFRFSFPDLNGKTVSDTDPRFQGNVMVVNITGSWCPNCHDEAPFLEELYRKYRKQGFEIVALSFEEADQLANPTRLRAFIRQYGIEYTVLLGGTPDEVNAKLPQAVNLNSWPTTFFIGREGHVRSVHAGFPGEASGPLHTQLKEEVTALVEKLLAEQLHTRTLL
jgi:thiol-disulfide isomerase/thioredoxin